MSVLIKGMYLPDMCSECDFCGGLILPDGIYCCECPSDMIHGKNISRAIVENCRHSDCPLIEIPEKHGRLVDTDDVKARMIPLDFSVQNWISEVELSFYKTVIEAEEGEVE